MTIISTGGQLLFDIKWCIIDNNNVKSSHESSQVSPSCLKMIQLSENDPVVMSAGFKCPHVSWLRATKVSSSVWGIRKISKIYNFVHGYLKDLV